MTAKCGERHCDEKSTLCICMATFGATKVDLFIGMVIAGAMKVDLLYVWREPICKARYAVLFQI